MTTAQRSARCRQGSVVFVRFALGLRCGRVFARGRHVLGVLPAIAAVASSALHALLEADEAAIAAAAATYAATQILTPRIVLRPYGGAGCRDEHSQNGKKIPHGRPPGFARTCSY